MLTLIQVSIHALLAESDNQCKIDQKRSSNFYPRSPCGERQSSGWGIPNWESISIHALLAESDLPTASAWTLGGVFLSTLSLRRATHYIQLGFRLQGISIHALLAESDCAPSANGGAASISIHALLAESDQLTPIFAPPKWHFYPRSPCGERPHPIGVLITVIEISIHALLAESDPKMSDHPHNTKNISIHALLAESDPGYRSVSKYHQLFLSTLSLRRATRRKTTDMTQRRIFLSTLSLRRATPKVLRHCTTYLFLSTLSLRRATPRQCPRLSSFPHFYPRSPCGERLDISSN